MPGALSAEDGELRRTDTHMLFSIATSEVFHVAWFADGDTRKDAEAPVGRRYSMKREGDK